MGDNFDIQKYYQESEATGKIHKVRVPTFFLNADDDVIVDNNYYP